MDEQSILQHARSLSDSAARATWLTEVCGADDSLRQRIDKQLRQSEMTESGREQSRLDPNPTRITPDDADDPTTAPDAQLAPTVTAGVFDFDVGAGRSVLQSLTLTIDVPQVRLRDDEGVDAAPNAATGARDNQQRHSGDRYELLGEIARGGMGAVLRGRDNDLGRELAIKVLLDSHQDNPDILQRFIEEAQIGGQLQHPGIAPVYELGQLPDRRPFFSMKLVKGETLSKLLARRKQPNEDRSRFIGVFEQVCQTMAYAHSRGVIHRDLKPANIMVGAFGEVQVMDWGLAKVMAPGEVADGQVEPDGPPRNESVQTRRSQLDSDASEVTGQSGSQTQAGSVMGTLAYMPPEQALGEISQLDERADVFGLGAVLCEILTGKPPYTGKAIYHQAAQGRLDDCFRRLDECGADAELIQLAKQCLAPDTEQRLRNAGAVADRVTAYLGSVETKLRDAELQRAAEAARVVELRRRRKLHYLIAAILLAVSIGTGFAALHFHSLEEDQRMLAREKDSLATRNQKLADDREQERNDAIKAREEAIAAQADAEAARQLADSALVRETRQKEAAEEARRRADAAATLAEDRASEIRKTLYAAEMQSALIALARDGGVPAATELLEHWRPQPDEDDLRGWEWSYLRGRLQRAEHVLEHPGEIVAAEWSPDGQRVVSGSLDGIVRIWDAETGRLIRSLSGTQGPVRGLSLGPDGRQIATLHSNGNLQIREIGSDDNQQLVSGTGYLGYLTVCPVAWSPDGSQLAAARGQNEIAVISAETAMIEQTLEVPRSERVIRWHPDGQRLAVISGKDVIVWDLATGQSQRVFLADGGGCSDVAWKDDGGLLALDHRGIHAFAASGGNSETWRATPNRLLMVSRLAFSPSQAKLAVSEASREIRLINASTREVEQTLAGHTGDILSLKWNRDGTSFLSVGLDRTVRIWRESLQIKSDSVLERAQSIAWRPDSGELATANAGNFSLLRFPDWQRTVLSSGHNPWSISWAPDGRRVAIGNAFRGNVVNASDGARLVAWKGNEGDYPWQGELAWEPHGERFVSVSGSFSVGVSLHSSLDGAKLHQWTPAGGPKIAWHPAGGQIVLCSTSQGRVTVFDANHNRTLREWSIGAEISAVAWHPTGDLLAIARSGGSDVDLWKMPDAELLLTIKGGSPWIGRLAWSPDGALLAMGSRDGTVQLWNHSQRQNVLSFQQNGEVQNLAWDASGSRLAIQRETGVWIHDAAPGFIAEASRHALPSLDLLVAAGSDQILNRHRRAELLESVGRWDESLADRETLARLRPDDPWYAERRLWASLKMLEPDVAINQLETRLADNPQDVEAAKMLARLLVDRKGADKWRVLEVSEAVSEGGAVLLTQPDGSLLATGPNPDGDVYHVTGRTDLQRVTALRLESIPDERLPLRGAGRAADGNYQLGDIRVSFSEAAAAMKAVRVPIARAWADTHYDIEDRRFPIENAFDDDPDTGWDSGPHHTVPHQAIIEFDHAASVDSDSEVFIRIESATRKGLYPTHNLGRFRLAVTDQPHAAILADAKARVQQTLTASETWVLLGTLLPIDGRFEPAAEWFGRALDAAEDDASRAAILAQATPHPETLSLLLASRQEFSARLPEFAKALADSRNLSGAISLYSAALNLSPGDRELRSARGRVLASARRWQEALDDLPVEIGYDDRNLAGLALRAEAFENLERWSEAAVVWKTLLDASPGNPAHRSRWQLVLLWAGQPAELLAATRQRFGNAPSNSTIWLVLAPLLVNSGDRQAYESFRKEVAGLIDGSNVESMERGLKACLLTQTSDDLLNDLPISRLAELIENPDAAGASERDRGWLSVYRYWAQAALALARLRQGDFDGAIKATAAVLDSSTANSVARSFARTIECLALASQGNVEQARSRLPELRRLIRRQSNGIENRLIAEILLREAEALVDGRGSN